MNTLLWLVQLLLALTFLAFGLLHLLRPRDKLLQVTPWVEDYPQTLVKAVGALELMGALGVVLPSALGTAPGVVVASAVGLGLISLGGVVVHLLRSERDRVALPAVLLVAAVFVAWGRAVAL